MRKPLTLYILRCAECPVRYALAHDLAEPHKTTAELTLDLAMQSHLISHLLEGITLKVLHEA